MPQQIPDYAEDERILNQLTDAMDIEAFSNLMVCAHQQGTSAADLVREEPERTSRKRIRKLCLKNRKRFLRLQFASAVRALWDRPVQDPAVAVVHAICAPDWRPPEPGKNGQNGRK